MSVQLFKTGDEFVSNLKEYGIDKIVKSVAHNNNVALIRDCNYIVGDYGITMEADDNYATIYEYNDKGDLILTSSLTQFSIFNREYKYIDDDLGIGEITTILSTDHYTTDQMLLNCQPKTYSMKYERDNDGRVIHILASTRTYRIHEEFFIYNKYGKLEKRKMIRGNNNECTISWNYIYEGK